MARNSKDHLRHGPRPPRAGSLFSSIGQLYSDLPTVLQKRILKQLFSCAVIVVLSLFLTIYFKSWTFIFGFVISLYLAHEGFDILYRYHDRSLIGKTMIVLKAAPPLGKQNHTLVCLREIDVGGSKFGDTYSLRLYGKREDQQLITANTILNIFLNPSNPADVIAWEIVDIAQ